MAASAPSSAATLANWNEHLRAEEDEEQALTTKLSTGFRLCEEGATDLKQCRHQLQSIPIIVIIESFVNEVKELMLNNELMLKS